MHLDTNIFIYFSWFNISFLLIFLLILFWQWRDMWHMNPGVPQYKNCWKWDYSAGVCRIQGTKYVKCNSPHQTIYYRKFVWCCKANEKTNPPRLETKKGEPCPHLFKCSNCKQGRSSSWLDRVSFLETLLQQRMAFKEIYKNTGNSKRINLFSCEQ